jgi:16S rRNA (adenine1518-N6/adenine1519-N6)-dimethyltransferase
MLHTRRPKLGQHFLSSTRYRERIADALRLRRDDLVIEIGPGRGAMTGLLAQRAGRVVAVELDAALASRLREEFASFPSVQIIHGDILTADLSEICRNAGADDCFACGNLPYYITSPILHRLFEFRSSIRAMALLMQREVAERVTAAPGSRDYGYLSVLVQLFSKPQSLFTVPPGAFSPPPKVQSALVEFRMNQMFPDWSQARASSFLNFVKACFAQKRKSLVNNLAALAPRPAIEKSLSNLLLSETVRAEQMTVSQLATLFAKLTINH